MRNKFHFYYPYLYRYCIRIDENINEFAEVIKWIILKKKEENRESGFGEIIDLKRIELR